MEEKKKLCPGDQGYQGGVFYTTVRIDGKIKEVKTIKDSNGNVTYVSVRDSFLGIF